MGSAQPNINTWSSWPSGPAEDVFHDVAPQVSAVNSSFMNQTTSQFSYSNNPLPIPDIPHPLTLSNSRSEVSSFSDSSPDTRSNGEDLDISTSSSRNRRTSKSPNDLLSPATSMENSGSKVKKRTLNTMAARRYRQKRVDQMQGLESALKDTETERDELKLQVARLEAEVNVLRGLIGSGGSKSS